MQMRSSNMWFALVAAQKAKNWALTGAGVEPNMSFGAGDLFTLNSLNSGSRFFPPTISEKVHVLINEVPLHRFLP